MGNYILLSDLLGNAIPVSRLPCNPKHIMDLPGYSIPFSDVLCNCISISDYFGTL